MARQPSDGERLTGRLHGLRTIRDHARLATVGAVLADYDAAGGGLLAGAHRRHRMRAAGPPL